MPTLCDGGGGGESGLRQPNSTVKGSKRRARQTQRQQERADGTRAGGSEMEDREQQKRWRCGWFTRESKLLAGLMTGEG